MGQLSDGVQAWILKPETWLVIYAAVVSSIALLWNVWRDLLTLRLRTSVEIALADLNPGNEVRVFFLVVNRSINRTLFITQMTGTNCRLWRTRQGIAWLCHWLRLPIPTMKQFFVGTTPHLPQSIRPGESLPVACEVGDPDRWRHAKRLAAVTADGRYLWCSRASVRRFREALDEEDAQWITHK